MVSVLEDRARYSLSWEKERLYTWAHRFTPRLKYEIHQLNLGNQSTNYQERLYMWAHRFTPHLKYKNPSIKPW